MSTYEEVAQPRNGMIFISPMSVFVAEFRIAALLSDNVLY